ncbi:MAG: phenylacetate--CoA ligase family protein [Actinobacteria bacterium]|nr:phenylacetate--CoA ligase family protein [Actinomycetota bacterium]
MDHAVARVVRVSAATVPAFAVRLAAAGLSADSIRGVADLAALPVLTKDDVLAQQHDEPPFGGLLAPGAQVTRVFQSPGPIYEPQLSGVDPWRWGQALSSMGFGADDTVLNCFGYHLSPAGAMFEEGALAIGARVLPGGIGSQDLQARAIADLGVTAYTGLPSYLKALLERFDELGLGRDRWHLTRALVTAEPLPDSLRALLEERVPIVRMAYGTAETGLLAYEREPGAGLVLADGVLVEVCDLDTGAPITEGEGQVVITLLRPEYPLVRFGTGDVSAWVDGHDGAPRLAGVLGRVGQAVKVRGMFLHPRQAQAAMAGVEGVEAWQLVVDRHDHLDQLRCEVVLADGADGDDGDAVLEVIRGRIRSGLRFASDVVAVKALPADASVIADVRDWS